MKQHSVPRSVHWSQACWGSSCCQHDLTVGVDQRQSHKGEVGSIKHTVLVVDGLVTKEKWVVAKNGCVEETGRLFDDGDEEVCDRWCASEEEDATDEQEGARDCAHLAVVQRETDGDVALHSHAGKDERGGTCGENCCHDLREAKRLCCEISGLVQED